MTDVVDVATRSRMMAGIRSCKTKPEIKVRKALHALGFRFSQSNYGLAGKPDIILPRWKVVVFVHGCFWHWHGCELSSLPGSNEEFWFDKLSKNKKRDSRVSMQLMEAGWRVVTIWECVLRGKKAEKKFNATMFLVAHWIREKSNENSYVVAKADCLEKKNAD